MSEKRKKQKGSNGGLQLIFAVFLLNFFGSLIDETGQLSGILFIMLLTKKKQVSKTSRNFSLRVSTVTRKLLQDR